MRDNPLGCWPSGLSRWCLARRIGFDGGVIKNDATVVGDNQLVTILDSCLEFVLIPLQEILEPELGVSGLPDLGPAVEFQQGLRRGFFSAVLEDVGALILLKQLIGV